MSAPMPQAVAVLRARFACAPSGWLRSAEGRRLLAKSLRHLRRMGYRKDARMLSLDAFVWMVAP